MKRLKRDRTQRAYTQGYKAGQRGHEMESCPHWEMEARGAWFRGWREGRENHLYSFSKAGVLRMAPPDRYNHYVAVI